MLKSIGELCSEISKYAGDTHHEVLSYILKMAAAEAYDIADTNPGWAAIDLAPLRTGIFDLDVSSDIIFSDPICAEFFGASPTRTAKGIANADFINALHPDDRDRVLASVAHALSGGSIFDCKYRLIVHGRLRWIHAKAFCTLDQAGRPVRFPGTVTDITASELHTVV